MHRLIAAVCLLVLPIFGAFPDICVKCWYEVPNSVLDSVAPVPTPPGWGGLQSRMYLNGGAFDSRRNRFIFTGGGYSDYAGNEVYAFDVDSLKWFRIKDGADEYDDLDSLYAYYLNGGAVPDSQQPRPGNNYDQIEYDSISDNLYILGAPYPYFYGHRSMNVFQLNMSTLTWSHPTDVGARFFNGSISGRDPSTGKIWMFANMQDNHLGVFDPSNGTWTNHGDIWSDQGIPTVANGAFMPPTNRLISIGVGTARYWNTSGTGYITSEELPHSGCDSLIAPLAPGFEWSPVENKMVGWVGGTKIITMDTTYTCEEVEPSTGNTVDPGAPHPSGTFGRWRYVPKHNVFIMVNSTTGNVYLYRHSAAPGDSLPSVEITEPESGYLTNQGNVAVAWEVNGVPQATGTTEVLNLEGANEVIRCSGMVCDTITVFLDQTSPVVEITSPASGTNTPNTSIMVRWTVDGIPDSALYQLVSGINQIIRSSVDLAGNVGADTIIVNGKFLTASAAAPDTVFTYSNFSLNAGNSAASEGGNLVFEWTQIAGGPVTIAGDNSRIASVLSRKSGLLTFELKIEETGSSIPADFDTISIAVKEPATLSEMLDVLSKGSQAQDSQFTIKIGTPNPVGGVAASVDDTVLLAGTMSPDTGTYELISWYTPSDSGTFQPQDSEWDSLPVPLEEGDNWITLVHGRGSRIAVDRILIGYQPGVMFGEVSLSPDVFFAGRATDFQIQVPVHGDSIESVHLVRIDGNETIVGEMKDDGVSPDAIANDSIFGLEFSLTPSVSTTYLYRVKVAFTNRPDAYSPIHTYQSQKLLTHADFQEVSEINSLAANLYDSLLSISNQEQAMNAVADWLIGNPEVVLAGIAPGGNALCWRFSNGILAFINAAPAGTRGGINRAKTKGISPHLSEFAPWDEGISAYNDILQKQNTVAYHQDTLKADSAVGLTNTNISIDDWKNWGGYKTVVIATHGNTFGYGSPNQIRMKPDFDSLEVNGFTLFMNPYQVLSPNILKDSAFAMSNRSDFNSPGNYPRMVLEVDGNSGDEYVWLTPKFIERYDKGLEGTLVYVAACRSTYNSDLWNAIRGNGDATTAMIGYSEYVWSTFATEMGKIIYRNLTRGSTLKTSMDSAVGHCASVPLICGGAVGGRAHDTSAVSPAFLDFMGNKNYSLIPNQVWSWGYNGKGRLGKGDTSSTPNPVKVKDVGILKVAAGGSRTLLLAADSTIWAWGDNSLGQTGLGTGYYIAVSPAKISSIGKARDIAAGPTGIDYGNTYAILTDSTLVGWGANALGSLGAGGTSTKFSPTPVSTSTKFLAVAPGAGHTLAIAVDSTLWVWGINFAGQLGIGTQDTIVRTTPILNNALGKVVAVAATEHASFAITTNGTLYGWGSNDAFVLGDTSTTVDVSPMQIMSGVKTISGGYFPVVIKNDGTTWYWGGYSFLYAGYNNGTPKRFKGIGNTVSVCAGMGHLLALDSKGAIKGMGENYFGKLGDGTHSHRSGAVAVGKFTQAKQVSCGDESSFATQ